MGGAEPAGNPTGGSGSGAVHARRRLKGAKGNGRSFVHRLRIAKPGATFEMERQFVEGEFGYILWTAETADNRYELATDTFVVRDGKIAAR